MFPWTVSVSCAIPTLACDETWHTPNPGIFRTLLKFHPEAYSEPCHIYQNLRTFRTLTYLKPVTKSEPIQRFKMELFAKIVKSYNYFSKVLHLRSLTEFWIRLSLSKCSLICTVTLSYTLYDTYFCGIVRSPCSFDIFRALSTHILAFNACILRTLNFQNFIISRIFAYVGPEAYSESSLFRHIQVYSGIFNYNVTLTSFFHFNLTYFSTKFKKELCFLTTVTSIWMLDWVYLNKTRFFKIVL